MKKLFVVSLLVINLPAFGAYTSTITNGCGTTDTKNIDALFEINSYTCSSGTYLPIDGTSCETCPVSAVCDGGTFTYSTEIAQGIHPNVTGPITQNAAEGCGLLGTKMDALFEINSYNCSSGQFLPADGLACASCPSNATCGGGTYEYNATQPQGITVNYPVTSNQANLCSNEYPDVMALFDVNEYNCTAGQYLPANGIECATCPADSYCGGGTYTFNETNAQGATACDTGAHSPAGASSASQCVMGYTCTSGQYLPKNTTTCVACPNGYTCAGGTFSLDENNDQGIVGNTITVIWNGASAEDVAANNAGTITYGGDIRTPVRPDPSQIPIGKRFVGWTFRKTNN